MKWINEKTVQGEPNDSNLTEVGKAIKLANSIVHCKDCKYWEYEEDGVGFCIRTEDCDWNADDFCSKGVKR